MADATDSLFNEKLQQIAFYHQWTKTTLAFKAFLTQYSESWTNSWEEKELVRRINKQYTFNAVHRSISLSWALPSYSPEEAKINLNKCSMFARMLYPRINEGRIEGTNPVWFLSMMNLIHNTGLSAGGTQSSGGENGLKGFPSGFTFQPDLEQGVFDVAPGIIYPKLINLSCEYRVIFDELHTFGWEGGAEGGTSWGTAANFPFGEQVNTATGATSFETGLEETEESPVSDTNPNPPAGL
tara:strand:+ start:12520 stop:13239 length:720 start_codon:yes stop_codon:yes gene_type:complete